MWDEYDDLRDAYEEGFDFGSSAGRALGYADGEEAMRKLYEPKIRELRQDTAKQTEQIEFLAKQLKSIEVYTRRTMLDTTTSDESVLLCVMVQRILNMKPGDIE